MGCLFSFIFGILGGVIALVLFGGGRNGGTLHQTADVYTFFLGGVVTVPLGFVIGAAFDQRAAAQRRRTDKPVKQFPRQIAGSLCGVCGKSILMAADGCRCDPCESVLHTTCADRHSCPPPVGEAQAP